MVCVQAQIFLKFLINILKFVHTKKKKCQYVNVYQLSINYEFEIKLIKIKVLKKKKKDMTERYSVLFQLY